MSPVGWNSYENSNTGDAVFHERSINVSIRDGVEACVACMEGKAALCVVEEVPRETLVCFAVELCLLGHLFRSAVDGVDGSVLNMH